MRNLDTFFNDAYSLIDQHPNDPAEIGKQFHRRLLNQDPIQDGGVYSMAPSLDQIPKTLELIIEKCFAVSPADTYTDSAALKADLDRCSTAYKKHGEIPFFFPGTHPDPKGIFEADTLIGRDTELGQLHEWARPTHAGPKLILVDGEPGIGKTALVRHAFSPKTSQIGLFASGKCDQVTAQPYLAVTQAFSQLAQDLKRHPEYDRIKTELNTRVHPYGSVVTSLIPEFETIIDSVDIQNELETEHIKHAYANVIRQIIDLATTEWGAVTLCIDDLQWADADTLWLIGRILENSDLTTIIVGIYRSKEAAETPMVAHWLSSVTAPQLHRMTVPPMSELAISEWLHAAFKCSNDDAQFLTQLVKTKAGGNPLDIRTTIDALISDDKLHYDPVQSEWVWNRTELESMTVSHNVAELLTRKLAHLPAGTQEVLATMAAIGNRVSLTKLATALEESPDYVRDRLDPAIQTHMVIPPIKTENPTFQFSHDRVQEACYTYTPATDQPKRHLQIARRWQSHPESVPELSKTDIVDQLNLGQSAIVDEALSRSAAYSNLEAAETFRNAGSFDVARSYFIHADVHAQKLSSPPDTDTQFRLEFGRAETDYLTAHEDDAVNRIDRQLKALKHPLHRSQFQALKTTILLNQGKYKDSLDAAVEGLRSLGVRVPRRPTLVHVLWQFGLAEYLPRLKFKKRNPVVAKAVLRLLVESITPAYFNSKYSYGYFSMVLYRWIESHPDDLTAYRPYVRINYASVLIAGFDRVQKGYEIARREVRKILEYPDRYANASRSLFMYACFILHRVQPFYKGREILLKGGQIGIKEGDTTYGGFCFNYVPTIDTCSGRVLNEIKSELTTSKNSSQSNQNFAMEESWHEVERYLNVLLRADEKLLENHPNQASDIENPVTHSASQINQVLCAAYLGQFDIGRVHLKNAREVSQYMDGLLQANWLDFYGAIVSEDKNTRKKIRNKLKKWAIHCPENFQAQYLILEGLITHFDKNDPQNAALYFDDAMLIAKEHNLTHEAGLAARYASQAYEALGDSEKHATYTRKSEQLLKDWGLGTQMNPMPTPSKAFTKP